jgi:hypothetical protein
MKNSYSKLMGGLGLAVLLTGVTGCETMTNKHDERSEGRVKDDKNITASVKKNLKNEPVYKFEDVQVSTFAGVVQLSGFVNSEDQKMRAQDIASRTAGVHQVVNGLSMKQFSTAQTGRGDVNQSRIYSEPPPSPYQSPKQAAQNPGQTTTTIQKDTTEPSSEPK